MRALTRQSGRPTAARGRSARARWKAVELELARRLGGQRVPVTGRQRGYAPDIEHPWLAIEVKSRKSLLAIIATMMDQARRAAAHVTAKGGGERLPIGIYHVAGTHLDNALVFMRVRDFEEWFCGLPEPEEGECPTS